MNDELKNCILDTLAQLFSMLENGKEPEGVNP